MNDIKAEKLKKRTFADLLINTAVFAAVLVRCLVFFGDYFKGRGTEFLLNGIYTLLLFGVMGILSLILVDIRKNGKPFSRSVIVKLRLMAVITMICGFLPSTASFDAGDDIMYSAVIFDTQNLVILALGIIIGIISEIFVYGYELQQDNDMIA